MPTSLSSSSCSGLFVCTAILCWDYHRFRYTFFNITKCTPRPIYFKPTLHLTAENNNYYKAQEKHLTNGFICSNCSRENFRESNENIANQCYERTTRIKLNEYCWHRSSPPACQCLPSNQAIQPIRNWAQALVKPGKGLGNTNRVNDINQSALPSIYILIGTILFLVLLGGIVGTIVYRLKLKSSQSYTGK